MGFVAEESHSSLRHSALHPRATKMDGSVARTCRAALSGDEEALKCRSSVSCCTLGRRKCTKVLPKRAALHPRATKSVGFVAEESLHPYVILPYTHGQQKWTEVSPERVVPHSRATKMDRSVTQACRAAPSSDKKARNCCSSVPCCTPRRRKVWVSLPRSPLHPYVILPCTFRQRKWAEVSPESVLLHPRATKMRDSVAQACRAALSGDENARKCHPSVPYFTLGRRIVWVSLPRSPIHPYVILSCTFRQRKWAEVSPESVLLHPRATKMRDSVAQACRAALSGDENARKCHPSVPYFTLGRRIVWVSLPRSPIHPYVILSCTFRQRKWAEVSPERVVPHSRATILG